MRNLILRFATIVTCLVLCSAPYQVQAAGYILTSGTYIFIDVPGGSDTQATVHYKIKEITR
jgi:hypothetical protein